MGVGGCRADDGGIGPDIVILNPHPTTNPYIQKDYLDGKRAGEDPAALARELLLGSFSSSSSTTASDANDPAIAPGLLRRAGSTGSGGGGGGGQMMVSTRLSLPPVGPKSPRREWVVLAVDRVLNPFRAYHIEVSWLVCSAKNVRDLVGGLSRKAQQLGLCLVPVPAYARSARLNVHPFIAHPFLPLPGPPSLRKLCEEALVGRFGFVGDDERVMDWQDVLALRAGLSQAAPSHPHHPSSALTTSLQQQQQQSARSGARPPWVPAAGRGAGALGPGQGGQQPDRQYCHRAGWAFVRVASPASAAGVGAEGFLWLSNRLLR